MSRALLVTLITITSSLAYADGAPRPEPPDWCAGWKPAKKYGPEAFGQIYFAIDRSPSTASDAALAELAEAACDVPPGDPSYDRRVSDVARARARWTAVDGSSAADQQRFLRYLITHDRAAVAKARTAMCAPATPTSVFARFEDRARRDLLGCDAEPHRERLAPPFDSLLYWIDTPGYEPSAMVRLLAAHECLNRRGVSTVYCAYDVARVDLAAVDREAASLDELAQLRIHFAARVIARAVDALAAKISPEDLAAAKKVDESWQALYGAHRAEIDRAMAIQLMVYGNEKLPETEACDAALADLRAIHAATTARNIEEAESSFTTLVPFLVRSGVVTCDAALDRPGLQGAFRELRHEPRGPRMMLALDVLGASFDASFHPPWSSTPQWPRRVPKLRRPSGREAGVVRSVKRAGDYLEITFAKVTMPFEENFNCQDTGRISGIDNHGDVRYGVRCETRTVQLDVTPDPIRVLAAYGAGIRPGAGIWYVTYDGNYAFPAEVRSGRKLAKLEAFGGFALRTR